MKKAFLILFSFIGISQGLPKESVPCFELNQERSFDGSPSVSITFPDGYTDTMILSRHFNDENDEFNSYENCHFIGHLEGEPDACIAMTGCPGSEDLEFTIMSEHSDDTIFKWYKDGQVEVIESPFKDGKGKSEMLEVVVKSRNAGNETWTLEDGDEEVDNAIEAQEAQIEANCSNGGACESVQSSNELTIRVGYGEGFLSKTGSHDNAKAYIQASMPHIQALYCHSTSLGTKIKVKIDGPIKFYSGKNLQASGPKLQEMWDTTKSDLGSADLMMYMGYDTDLWGTIGIAYKGTVCQHAGYNKYKQSINEWRPTHAEAGHTIAHEIGHNLGMSHDFSESHAAAGCDKTGVMSYGPPVNKWSTCSRADFQAHYIATKSSWCMPVASNFCTDLPPSTSTTSTTTTNPPVTCNQGWIGDGYCDPQNNFAECQWDGNDCCDNSNPGWNSYCGNQCVCKSKSSTTTTTTTTTTSKPSVTCNQGWIGDGYCDPQNNFAECQWDGDDCCNNSKPNWDAYCGQECNCKNTTG